MNQTTKDAVQKDEQAAFEEIRSALDETYGFASTSPRAQENINFVFGKLDEIEKARAATTSEVAQAPVAILHDDGRYTWLASKSHGFSYAGWRMKVYAAPVAPTAEQAEGVRLTYPAEFTEDLQWILGLICFQCIQYARTLRKAGRDIPTKAEAEQAATVDWMLRHYLRDPENWRKTAADEMRAMAAAASSTGDQA